MIGQFEHDTLTIFTGNIYKHLLLQILIERDVVQTAGNGYANIDLSFNQQNHDDKNQIENYLDKAFGGIHKAEINETIEYIKNKPKICKKFMISKNDKICDNFKIIYICRSSEFANWLLKIGKDQIPIIDGLASNIIQLSNNIVLQLQDINNLIQLIYPNLSINSIYQFPGKTIEYFSANAIEKQSNSEYHPSDGLCNKIRLVCYSFQKNVIEAEIITGKYA
ncbi:hypothetical protein RhiirA4_473571 [Rhizophagus irregularis]|uniref:Uncharacterized protein n=1 Tax=Rhizophagus irregularis TaxID=588596 RepID=A0A2I1H6Y8_9GLOM|nr:hypothetical protein RhiirA4_473571 [Rhizophagus irregularis]